MKGKKMYLRWKCVSNNGIPFSSRACAGLRFSMPNTATMYNILFYATDILYIAIYYEPIYVF